MFPISVPKIFEIARRVSVSYNPAENSIMWIVSKSSFLEVSGALLTEFEVYSLHLPMLLKTNY